MGQVLFMRMHELCYCSMSQSNCACSSDDVSCDKIYRQLLSHLLQLVLSTNVGTGVVGKLLSRD